MIRRVWELGVCLSWYKSPRFARRRQAHAQMKNTKSKKQNERSRGDAWLALSRLPIALFSFGIFCFSALFLVAKFSTVGILPLITPFFDFRRGMCACLEREHRQNGLLWSIDTKWYTLKFSCRWACACLDTSINQMLFGKTKSTLC